jgi:hypothetical protein
MSRGEARFVHAANLLVGLSGLVYAWMLYLMEPVDAFAIVNHPLQPEVQHLHVLTAPLFVFALGLVWVGHVWRRIVSGHPTRRSTGLVLAAAAWPMVASAYAIQVSVDEGWRTAWIWIHVGTSLLWVPVYLVHQLGPRDRSA